MTPLPEPANIEQKSWYHHRVCYPTFAVRLAGLAIAQPKKWNIERNKSERNDAGERS